MKEKELTKLIETESRSKSNTKRIDEHDQKIDNLEKTYSMLEKMDYRMGKVEDVVDKIDKKITEGTSEKGKKWDKFIDYLFYFVLATLLAYIAKNLGIK